MEYYFKLITDFNIKKTNSLMGKVKFGRKLTQITLAKMIDTYTYIYNKKFAKMKKEGITDPETNKKHFLTGFSILPDHDEGTITITLASEDLPFLKRMRATMEEEVGTNKKFKKASIDQKLTEIEELR